MSRNGLGCLSQSGGGDEGRQRERMWFLAQEPWFSFVPHPPALEQPQPHSGSLLADPSGSKSEKSSFQTQLDVPRWPLSANIAICMRLFNQAQSNKKAGAINIRSCTPAVMRGKCSDWKLRTPIRRGVGNEGEGEGWRRVFAVLRLGSST